MKKIDLTNEELRVLDIYLNTNPCESGCVFEEMQTSKKDCDECEFPKVKDNLLIKLELL